jgi:monoamine oxidase
MPKSYLDRRTLIQCACSTALSAFTPTTARAQNRVQVVVIGAGISGLHTALLLQEEGIDVQVIEGRMRAGGRLYSLDDIPGTPEAGANSFGIGYARLFDAAERYGAETKPNRQSYMRNMEIVIDDRIVPIKEWPDHPKNPLPKEHREDTPWGYYARFMKGHIPFTQPADWLDPKFLDLDTSFDNWMLKEGLSDKVIDMICNHKWEYNNSTHDVSALAIMSIYAWGQTAFAEKNGVRSFVFKGGNQRMPETMAAKLKREVHFGKEVVAIRSENDGAEVHCADGSAYRSDRVVSSIPFPVLRRIKVEPYFSGVQRKAIWTVPFQSMVQVHMVPAAPFWEQDGFSPNMHIADSPVGFVMSNYGGDDAKELTSIMAFLYGNKAERADQMDEESAKAMVVSTIEKIRPAAKGKLEVAGYKSWFRDPFATGRGTSFGPGQVSRFAGKMNAPHGRIHLCGDVTALSSNGAEAALESAERAAVEIFDLI